MSKTLLRNGTIHPGATAMLVDGERIAWIGTDEAGIEADEVVDLGGRLVTPAFVDAHVHTSGTGLFLSSLDLAASRSAADVLAAVSERARSTNDAVLLGYHWDESTWADTTLPTAAELDRAASGLPVYLSRVDGHSGLVSHALADRVPGLSRAEGWDGTGRVERDAHHRVRDAVDGLVTEGQLRQAIGDALAAAARVGIGCVHELSAPHINAATDLALIRQLTDHTITVLPYWGQHVADGGIERARELGCLGAAGDLNVDGAFGSRTAALLADYDDQPGHRGHRYLEPEAVAEHVVACTRAGMQAGFHCIGDAGTASAVEGFRLAEKQVGTDALVAARHRLEHVELLDPASIPDLARLGIVVSAQPAFDAAWGGTDGMYAARLGPERALASNPLASLHDGGVTLAFGSDSSVTPLDPWGGVRAAISHHNAEQRLPIDVAFAAHTIGGWRAAAIDDAGELRQDSLATYAVWDTTAFPTAEELNESTPRCLRTVVRGAAVFDEEGALT